MKSKNEKRVNRLQQEIRKLAAKKDGLIKTIVVLNRAIKLGKANLEALQCTTSAANRGLERRSLNSLGPIAEASSK